MILREKADSNPEAKCNLEWSLSLHIISVSFLINTLEKADTISSISSHSSSLLFIHHSIHLNTLTSINRRLHSPLTTPSLRLVSSFTPRVNGQPSQPPSSFFSPCHLFSSVYNNINLLPPPFSSHPYNHPLQQPHNIFSLHPFSGDTQRPPTTNFIWPPFHRSVQLHKTFAATLSSQLQPHQNVSVK